MIRNLVFLGVTVVAIGIGYHDYTVGNLGIFGKSCHRRFQNPFGYMATKTPYRDAGLDEEAELGDPYVPYHGGTCAPSMTWHLVRHGTRNPSSKVIRKIKALLPRLREQILIGHKSLNGKLCAEELEEIQAWSPASLPEESNEKFLVPSGEMELLGISRRFKLRFPDVFLSQYHNDTFKFKFTKTQRAEASAKHYTKGIFHESQLDEIFYPPALDADPVLRFYKDCPKWKKEVDKNPEAYQERIKFETSYIFKEMISNLQERLGLENPLTLEEVEIMHLTCSFESAWNPANPSPWCHIFDEYDYQLLEYRQDLEYYWIDGYGYQLTYEQACPTIQDIVYHLSEKVEDTMSPSVIAYFTHSGTILKVIARLGLFNDSIPLLGNNFDHHRSSRKWKMSQINSFATNIAFILYRCPQNYKVGLMFQEKPIAQPLCKGKILCPLNEFYTSVEPIVKNCDKARLCKL